MNTNFVPRSSLPFFIWLGYVFFVIYGSLVPLHYKARPLSEAWSSFQNIPFLELGVESRADWIANGVLYVPVAFLTTYLLTQAFRRIPRIFLFGIAAVFSVTLAVAVEFTQLFFPARTVSLNDILAECLGSLVGLALSAKYANWFGVLLKSFFSDSQRLKVLVLDGYVFAYLAFALFPYDFLLSPAELSAKINSSSWGWLVAKDSPRLVLLSLKLGAEVVLTLPFGFLFARSVRGGLGNYKGAVIVGLLLGAFIEVAQFFIASGVSQGLSVLTRGVGVCGGLALSRYGSRWTIDQIAFVVRRYTPAIVLAYALTLLEINGWFTFKWHGLDTAALQLAQINFLPFYYHYFTSESIALFSLGVVSLSYAPIGLLAWAHGRSPWIALVISLFSATAVESGKLFFQDTHPDPTNILLACAAGWLTVLLVRQLSRNDRKIVEAPVTTVNATRPLASSTARDFPFGLFFCLAGAGLWTAAFPAFPAFVALALITCAIVVWRRPVWVFAIIPSALPVFDLAPWSGRFFLDEFDALLLVGLAVAYNRAPAPPRSRERADVLFAVLASLLVMSFVISALQGLRPFALPDANSFNNYYSPYNALRIVKGVFWAALIYILSKRFVATGVDVRRWFCWGMAVGLGFTVAVVFWERLAFSDLWNFSDGYRVTGPFSASHTGGAYIDCFLAAAVPFLIVLTLETRRWLVKIAGLLLILATTYALMVTFSRGGYLSFGFAVVIVLLVSVVKPTRFVRSGVMFAGLAGAMLLVAVPIFEGKFAQSRMADVGADLAFRKGHWEDALNIRDPDRATSLFGMGLGRFPDTKYWRSTLDPRPSTYQLLSEAGNNYLRLDSGDSVGVEQWVSLAPGQQYVLKMDVRASRPDAKITVPICEKWLLTSANCTSPTFELGSKFGVWRSVETTITADGLSTGPWYRHRPVKLSLTYAFPQSTIDIDNVRLVKEGNADLLRNGDFSEGLDHWFFSTAGTLHAHWRVHSLYYGVLFDQGWFGLVALGAFIALALCQAAQAALLGDDVSGASLAALSGFLVGGLFDTQIDTPRFLMLMLLLAWACFQPSEIKP